MMPNPGEAHTTSGQQQQDASLYQAACPDMLSSLLKGKQIPTYLVALGDHLTQERASVLKELSSLSGKIEHIWQIISMQQDFTRVGGLEASENLADLMDEALAINFASLERHHIEVIREYAEIPLYGWPRSKRRLPTVIAGR
jgi:hypothetical protein